LFAILLITLQILNKMTIKEQEIIVMECQKLANTLLKNCTLWLHKASNNRDEAALDLGLSADAMYDFLSRNGDIMGSDTGKPAFDEFNSEPDDDFQSDMNNYWNHEDERIERKMRQDETN